MVAYGEIAGAIIGAIIAGLIGIFTVYFTKYIEEKRNKKSISKALINEINLNHKKLTELAEYGKMWHEIIDGSNKDPRNFDFWCFPNELHFDQTIYSALLDKMGLLDSKNSENLVQYYVKIKIIEDQYKQLKGLHNITGYELTCIKEQCGTWNDESAYPVLYETYLGKPGNRSLPMSKIESFLRNVKDTFDLGKSLIENLKEQI